MSHGPWSRHTGCNGFCLWRSWWGACAPRRLLSRGHGVCRLMLAQQPGAYPQHYHLRIVPFVIKSRSWILTDNRSDLILVDNQGEHGRWCTIRWVAHTLENTLYRHTLTIALACPLAACSGAAVGPGVRQVPGPGQRLHHPRQQVRLQRHASSAGNI